MTGNSIVDRLISLGRPVTVESFLAFAYPYPLSDPLPAEIRMEAENAVEQYDEYVGSIKAGALSRLKVRRLLQPKSAPESPKKS